jgi:Phage tail lysozyme
VMAHGGTKEAGAGVGGVVAGESSGNPEAIEAGGGGGTGLIQWTPGSSAKPYQPLITGNVGRDMAVQLTDMLYYIDSRGGMGRINEGGQSGGPMGAAEVFSAMEAPLVPGSDIRSSVVAELYAKGLQSGGIVKLATGGEVRVPYLTGMTAGTAHNVLVAAGLKPRADAGQKANWWVSSSSPTGDAAVPAHDSVWINAYSSTKPATMKVPDLVGYEAGTAHNILHAMGLEPTAPAGQKATWQVTGSKPSKDIAIGKGGHVEILASAPITPGPAKTVSTPGGMDSAQAWSYYSSALAGLATAQKNEFWDLYNIKFPKAITKAQSADWKKDQAALFKAQSAMAADRDPLLKAMASPASMTAGQWTKLQTDLTNVKNLEYGKTDPSWNWPAWHYQRATWTKANQATSSMQSDLTNAYTAWKSLYGPGGSLSTTAKYTTPGVLVTPEGSGVSSPVDLQSLVVGGPANPVVTSGPSASSTGMGFAAGGLVGGGDGASLGQMAAMFALGSLPPQSALSTMGLGAQAQSKLSSAGSQSTPRTLSDAAGERVGLKVGNLTINNPVAEQPSQSITRSSNRLAFLAGRGTN